MRHREQHRSSRIGWLRAAVLGANDGIVSTASLIVGVASAASGRQEILVAGVAGLVAGALSMAAGEYVSVSSQADTERADLDRERRELATQPELEEDELTSIYVRRGLDRDLARQVASQLMAKDALVAHARDELGLTEEQTARPLQAAFASAATFTAGAAGTDPRHHRRAAKCRGRVRDLVRLPDRTRRNRGSNWRSIRDCRRRTRWILGRPGDGGHRGSRAHLRYCHRLV